PGYAFAFEAPWNRVLTQLSPAPCASAPRTFSRVSEGPLGATKLAAFAAGAAVASVRSASRVRRSAFFDEWALELEARLGNELREEELGEMARRSGGENDEAEILTRVWHGKALRRVRVVQVDGGPKLQAFNAVLYPGYGLGRDLGTPPVLGIDVLSFNSHKRLLFGVDWAPMRTTEAYAEAFIAPFLGDLCEDYGDLKIRPGGKVYGEDPEFFSDFMFFSRPEGQQEFASAGSEIFDAITATSLATKPSAHRGASEALAPGSELWKIFGKCPADRGANPEISILAIKRQERREEQRREKQRQLEWLFREVEIDWEQAHELMGVDGLQPNIKEAGSGITSLHRCASAGQPELLQWCIKMKADIDSRTQLGRSALHYACECSRMRCVRILLENQADANLRTLSYLTPLHLACQANSVEGVTALLQDTKQVVDVDAEDTKRRSAEALSNNPQIHRLVRKYRAQLDERRKAQLVEQCLHRLFNFFDVNQDGVIHPEEWVDSMTLLAEFFEHHSDQSIQKMFEEIDKDDSGFIDWQEFKAARQFFKRSCDWRERRRRRWRRPAPQPPRRRRRWPGWVQTTRISWTPP
ncbi:unnamed protein product, partial [Effrenium voratum]